MEDCLNWYFIRKNNTLQLFLRICSHAAGIPKAADRFFISDKRQPYI